ncbi:MAG: hypothetical protein C0518_04630 [Opitutus sp.]|nr:hypothetical protein [Opitutus sp.]
MKILAFLLLLSAPGLLSASVAARFFDHLTPEERRAAGIEELTEQQRAALSALADRWVEAKAEPAISAARAKAAAEVREEAKLEAKKRVGLEKPLDPAIDVIRARIAGTFRGWGKGTIFRLDNGQTWAVDAGSADSRFFSARENPEIEIRPAAFGTWKFYIMPEGLWVRVKRVQ